MMEQELRQSLRLTVEMLKILAETTGASLEETTFEVRRQPGAELLKKVTFQQILDEAETRLLASAAGHD